MEKFNPHSTANLARAGISEFIGVFLLVFAGCAAAISFGLGVMVMCYATADVSGGHLNPAISIAFAVTQEIEIRRCVLYVICQSLGAVCGALFLKALTPEAMHGEFHLGCNTVNPSITQIQAVGIEIITTFMLVVTFFMNFVDKSQPCHGNLAPIPVGFAVIVGILASGNLSGGSMNPARSLGPAVAAHFYQDLWVYWVGPIIGGALGGFAHKFALMTRHPKDETKY